MTYSAFHSAGRWLLVAGVSLVPIAEIASQQAEDPSPHSSAELIPEVESFHPGEPFTVALRISLDPGWHTYWLNPGDAGQPASIDWYIPAGYRAGEISWPYPRKVEESSVVSYGYDDEVMLLTKIAPPRFLTTGQKVRFAAQAHWLVCEDICLPAMADLQLEMMISEEEPQPNRRWQEKFEETRRTLPTLVESWRMSAEQYDDGYYLHIIPSGLALPSFDGAFFFANDRGVLDHGAGQMISDTEEGIRISLRRSPYAREVPARLAGVLVIPGGLDSQECTALAVVVDVAVLSRPNGS